MEPPDCCDSTCRYSPPNVDPPPGWVALISRGNCTFVQKVATAQRLGAAAVIVHNNRDRHQLVTMGGVPSGPKLYIPSVFVSETSGSALRKFFHDNNFTRGTRRSYTNGTWKEDLYVALDVSPF